MSVGRPADASQTQGCHVLLSRGSALGTHVHPGEVLTPDPPSSLTGPFVSFNNLGAPSPPRLACSPPLASPLGMTGGTWAAVTW